MFGFVLIPYQQGFLTGRNEIFLEKAETNFETGIKMYWLLDY